MVKSTGAIPSHVQALVHFTVGVIVALSVLSVLDRPVREEFLTIFASGFWGMVPDGHWLLHEAGLNGVAGIWRAFHATPYANVFWLHGVIDGLETGRPNLEAGIALTVLAVAVVGYYWLNDWSPE